MAEQLLILTHEFAPSHGGIATYVEETARAAQALGWPVTILAPRTAVATTETDWRVIATPVRGTQGWIERLRMRRTVSLLDLDWKDTTLWLPEPGPQRLWLYSTFLGLPTPQRLVLTFHGSEILRYRALPHRRHTFRGMVHRASTVGVVSGAVAGLLASVVPFLAHPPVLVPGAVRTPLSDALAHPAPRNPDREMIEILTVGRIHPRKGQLEVVEAIGRLSEFLRKRICYRMVGPVVRPGYLDRIRSRAAEIGVQLEGPETIEGITGLAEAYQRADVFVLASVAQRQSIEGFGLAYLEAAAAGCPVVATDSGGAGEAVGPESGIVVPPGDSAALAGALEALCANPKEREALGQAAPLWASQFSWQKNAHRLFGDPGQLKENE